MPKKTLTNAFIATLLAPEAGKQSLVWDAKLPGFGVRLTANKKVFIAQGRVNGRTVRLSIGRTDHLSCDHARALAKARLGELASGKDLNHQKKLSKVQGITLMAVFEDFSRARDKNKPGTLAGYKYCLNQYLEDWRNRAWTSITRQMVLERHQQIGERNGQRSANNVMRALRSIVNFARAKYRHPTTGEPLIAENPVRALSDTRSWFKEVRREDYLKPSEIKPWWDAVTALADDVQRDYLVTLLLTGCRANEIGQLRAKDIFMKDKMFELPDTKNGKPHRLPVCAYLQPILEQRMKELGPFDFVFPATGKSPSKAGHIKWVNRLLERVAKQADVEMKTRHGLRRTFASIGEQLDVGSFTLKRLMNHVSSASGDVTEGYVQLSVEALRKPSERISQFILKSAMQLKSADIAELTTANNG